MEILLAELHFRLRSEKYLIRYGIYCTQCCGSGAGSGSARIRNFCRIRNQIRNSRVPDPGAYLKMDMNINKNHQKKGTGNFIILTIFIYRY
jgi:hypothetical protein